MPKASIRARCPVSRGRGVLISCTRRAISVAAVPVQKDDPADQRLARVISSRYRKAFGNLSFGVHIRRHCVKWGIMRHNLVSNCARRALAIFASAALVAGLVPVAAFGEVGGGLPLPMRRQMLVLLSKGLRRAQALPTCLARGATPRARAVYPARGWTMLLLLEAKATPQAN